MKDLLLKLIRGNDLSRDESASAFEQIMSGDAEPMNVSALLMGLACKTLVVDEIVGAAKVMREKSTKIPLPAGFDVVDTCGTGGDIKGTFNISTAAAIVAAACGVKVVKHGNRSASSKSGSADVLEALGVNINAPVDLLVKCLEQANLCFAYARTFHPAMKHVAPVRQTLGVPTIFNLLGPLTNPAGATRQLLGVYKPDLAELMALAMRELGCKTAWAVSALDGLDEISTMSPTYVVELKNGHVGSFMLDPVELGVSRAKLSDLQVSTAHESADAIREVVKGVTGPRADIVLINAAAALVIDGVSPDIRSALERTRAAVASGAANNVLEKLVQTSQVLS